MASAIKRMAYCDLTLVPHITRKPKRDIDELKQRLIDTWDRIPQGIIDEAIDQRQTLLRTCVKGKGLHFEQLLWSNHTTGSCQSHFRHLRSLKPLPIERACYCQKCAMYLHRKMQQEAQLSQRCCASFMSLNRMFYTASPGKKRYLVKWCTTVLFKIIQGYYGLPSQAAR